jgi:hypothetical protein
MPINLNPATIANAFPYNAPLQAKSINACNTPREGAAVVPMQFDFTNTPVWLVNMQSGSPNPPLSQMVSMYVDASACDHDVNILFPDTGFEARIPTGTSKMLTVLTGKIAPQFYVILDDNGNVGPGDIVNVFASNVLLPTFDSGFPPSLIYGVGDFFENAPIFVNQEQFSYERDSPPFIVGPITIITATQWYLNDLECSGALNTNDGSTVIGYVQFSDGGVPFMSFPLVITPTPQALEVCNMHGLNYESEAIGNLSALFKRIDGGTDFSNIDGAFFINAFGGFLKN